ncbi:MAG: histone H1 [Rikenellaceae bacterium]
MEQLLATIKEQIAVFTENAELQVSKDNKAAGARARKAALELSKAMKEFRKASMDLAKK